MVISRSSGWRWQLGNQIDVAEMIAEQDSAIERWHVPDHPADEVNGNCWHVSIKASSLNNANLFITHQWNKVAGWVFCIGTAIIEWRSYQIRHPTGHFLACVRSTGSTLFQLGRPMLCMSIRLCEAFAARWRCLRYLRFTWVAGFARSEAVIAGCDIGAKLSLICSRTIFSRLARVRLCPRSSVKITRQETFTRFHGVLYLTANLLTRQCVWALDDSGEHGLMAAWSPNNAIRR